MDTRDIYKLVRELSEERDDVINLYDSMDIELNEGFVIETGVVGFTKDGVIVQLDEDAMEFLDFNGVLLESEIVKRDEYENVVHRGDDVDGFKAKVAASEDAFDMIYDAISGDYGEEIRSAIQEMYDDIVIDSQGRLHPDDDVEDIVSRIADQLEQGYYDQPVDEGAYSDHWDSKYDDDSTDPSVSPRDRERAHARRRAEDDGWDPRRDEMDQIDELADIKRLAGQEEVDEGLGKALLGGAALIAAITGINKYQANQLMQTEPQLVKLAQMRQEAEQKGDEYKVQELDDRIEQTLDHIRVTGRPVMGPDGEPVVPGEPLGEAEYQGREVPLNKPMQGDVKKSKVYVKKPDGKVVKVNFGDKDMKIKKSNPERRKSFRARHHCDNPGPKWKARYWSCKAW